MYIQFPTLMGVICLDTLFSFSLKCYIGESLGLKKLGDGTGELGDDQKLSDGKLGDETFN